MPVPKALLKASFAANLFAKKFVLFLMAFYFQPAGAALFLEPGRFDQTGWNTLARGVLLS